MLERDPLFIGMTRPPMIGGVTFLYMGLNAFGAFFAFLVTGNLLFLLVFIPLHAVGYAICLKDPQMLDVMVKRVQKTMGVSNRALWNGNSYDR